MPRKLNPSNDVTLTKSDEKKLDKIWDRFAKERQVSSDNKKNARNNAKSKDYDGTEKGKEK